jgi:hypothetical protein
VDDVLPFLALIATVTGCGVVVMVARALTQRLKGGQQDPHAAEEMEDMRAHVANLQGQLNEVLERQDFAERMLAQVKERGAIGPGQGTGAN